MTSSTPAPLGGHMEPMIIPIVTPQVDWQTFLSTATAAVRTSITKAVDKGGLEPRSPAAFIVSIAEFQADVDSALAILRDAGGLLKHLSYTFLFVAEESDLQFLYEESCLNISTTYLDSAKWKAAIVSGNLEQWRSAVINGCSDRVSVSYRKLMGKCLLFFEKIGLGELWAFHKKTTTLDGTFLLTHKR